MSQTLQNQILLAKSMNGIVSLSDGAGTTITNGTIVTSDLSGTNISANTFTATDLTFNGSVEIPAVNDIVNPVSGNPTISLLNRGRTQLIDDVYTVGYFNPNNAASTTNLRVGTIALKNQISTAINNLCIGNNAMQGADTPATGFSNMTNVRNIAIGNSALALPQGQQTSGGACYDNVCIGYNVCSLRNYFQHYQNVCIGSNVARGTGSRNSVIIGYNVGSGGSGNYDSAVVIGSNNAPNLALNLCAVVGSGNFLNGTGFRNGAFVLGNNNLQNSTAQNGVVCIGSTSLTNLANPNESVIAIGPNVGATLTTGGYGILMGQYSDVTNGTIKNFMCLGHNSRLGESSTFMVGGNDGGILGLGYTRYQDLCIAKKNRVLCGTQYSSTITINLAFENPEHVYILDDTTTTVNLPTPDANPINQGARFTIIRAYTGTFVAITINAPAGQTIVFNNTSSSTYAFGTSETYVSFTCIATTGSTWSVMASQQVSGFVDLTTNQTIGGIKTFSSPPVIADKVTLQSSQSITGTGTGTFSFGLGENVFVLNSTITTVTLPTPATANIDASFFIIKGNSTAEWSLAIVCGASQTMFVNGDGAATSYTMEKDETSIRVTCVAAVSGTVWNLHDNFKRRVQSFATNALYPVSPSWAYPANITTINSIAIGYGSFSNSTSGSRNNDTVSIGFNCLNQINNASAINNVCIGTRVLASTGTNNLSNNTCIGFESGYGFGQSGSRNTLIGATTNFNAASAFSDSTALGYGATITASNQMMIGRSSENVVIPGTLSVLNQYVHRGYGLITANATISAPYFEIYAIATPSATAISLTLPTPVVGLVGLKLTFRRVNANAAQVNSSQGYYPFTSNTVTSTILLTAVATTQVGNQISIVCLQNSATPTYGWFQTQ